MGTSSAPEEEERAPAGAVPVPSAEPGGGGASMLLDYERQMVEGLVEEDGLCIMSAGMGWQKAGRSIVVGREERALSL